MLRLAQLVWIPLLCLSSMAHAHRKKTVLTTMECNPRTGLLEIIHRTYAHDVEHTLGNTLQARGGLDNLEAQARISLEFSNSFTLWDHDGERIPLQLVGGELESEFFYIYQETACDRLEDIASIRHAMLRNYWPDMANTLNIYRPAGTLSLLFAGATDIQSLSDPAH